MTRISGWASVSLAVDQLRVSLAESFVAVTVKFVFFLATVLRFLDIRESCHYCGEVTESFPVMFALSPGDFMKNSLPHLNVNCLFIFERNASPFFREFAIL